ncbi:MAG: alpha-ketoacid dehydrogenase subunit beta [Candidatus Eisenbacteria bacterium]|uniref:Alpha-ketoacid dehydrogenase subunit beta n=1 Tax=Eiseniibacteriota bacterium TaxID=2212470 RepID=A0A7Y2H1A6_UNCEI|nr:alpha-ketoacid dehydrogenase subunit beta [Candidatus Eisenbacteria bacterium]
MSTVTYLEAIRDGLHEEMERDESVFLIGEDVATYGGAFGVTTGLKDSFGEERILDTPISEVGFTGAAIGAAMMGMRPVVEFQFLDFIACAFNIITNYAATTRYRTGNGVPMVMRGPMGGGVRGGPFHSQNPESFFFNTPGLKIVAPATAYDAKGLLKSSIRDNDPVIFLEHKYLYRRMKDDLPSGEILVPIGEGLVRKKGGDLSIITFGSMVHRSLEAADALEKEGIHAEVIDLRSLLPFDEALILESIKKTGKALIVHEATLTGGVGAEFAARISEKAFEYLDGPVTRVASLDTPVPYSPPLEDMFMPSTQIITNAARKLAHY